MRDFVHRALARKMIGGGGQRPIRTLAQRWILRGMKLGALVGNVIRRVNRCRTGVVVVELPGDEGSVGTRPCLYVDDSSRTEIRPHELFFASPLQLYRLSGSLGQARAFHRSFAGMLAAVRRSRIGNNDAHVLLRQMKGLHQFIANGKWTLRACPDRELISA